MLEITIVCTLSLLCVSGVFGLSLYLLHHAHAQREEQEHAAWKYATGVAASYWKLVNDERATWTKNQADLLCWNAQLTNRLDQDNENRMRLLTDSLRKLQTEIIGSIGEATMLAIQKANQPPRT
jgi:hypothetical protein